MPPPQFILQDSRICLTSGCHRQSSSSISEEDGTIPLQGAADALASLLRGKASGKDGLIYKFYPAFWGEMRQLLVDVFKSVFTSQQQQPHLSQQQRLGSIALIHKDGGKPRDQVDSYKPNTLNADVKISAKVMALEYGAVLDSVVVSTNTAVVSGWDTPNVLCHLEEVGYLAAVQQPVIVPLLDFEEGYDCLNWGWPCQSMASVGFPVSALRRVQLQLRGTTRQILYNKGVKLPGVCRVGSSPYSQDAQKAVRSARRCMTWHAPEKIIEAQLLALKCRQLQREQQGFSNIGMPDGTPAPVCHQHFNDATLHAASVLSLQQPTSCGRSKMALFPC